jgi:predicted DsbA family dithiol-disulfide isomerase
VEIAAALDLPRDEARNALESRSYRQSVDADWNRATELGVTAVPTFVIDGRGLVGAQPYETLENLVSEAGAQRR